MIPPVGLCWLGNIVAAPVAVHAKYCPLSWHYYRSYLGGPKREIIPRAIQGGGRLTLTSGYRVKHGGLVIPDPQLLVESPHNTSKVDSG